MIELNEHVNVWIAFVNIRAKEGLVFNELISTDENCHENYIGAWASILLKADVINIAIDIIPKGLDELGFDVVFIDKIENVSSLIDDGILNQEVLNEIEWLQQSNFVFKISDALFPYT